MRQKCKSCVGSRAKPAVRKECLTDTWTCAGVALVDCFMNVVGRFGLFVVFVIIFHVRTA